MTWAAESAPAVVAVLDDAFVGDVVVAVAAVDAAGPTVCGGPPDGRFELGSVTKTMTATLLASLVGAGRLGLDDEIGRWLAAGPNSGITVAQLATHTSGLPRLAPDQPTGGANPYLDLTAEVVQEGLRAAPRGDGFAYSNFGYQVLGLVLERASGRSYAELLADLLLDPLGMTCSGVGDAGGGARLTGHADGRSVGHWDFTVPGPGGVEASAADLARYLAACLRPPETALGAAIRLAQTPRVRIDEHREIGLGWIVREGGVVWHNGGTGGFAASIGVNPREQRALGILASTHGHSVGVLDQVLLHTLGGGDPAVLRPQPGGAAGPEWDERGRSLVDALLAGRFADVHRNLVAANQSRITADQLGQAWQRGLDDAGAAGAVTTSSRTLPGGVAVLAVIDCANRPLSVLLSFAPDGQLAGLRMLRPGEAAPW